MEKIKTPHIEAKKGDFAKTVLMPGDPKRSRYVAKNLLQNAKLINDVRGMQTYTGTYKGKRVSVMASGMGLPSMAIFSHELYSQFGVENIIRIGTCGSVVKDVKVGDIIVAVNAITNSNFADNYKVKYAPIASEKLLKISKQVAKKTGLKIKYTTIFTLEAFYQENNMLDFMLQQGATCIDMECLALYINAQLFNKHALTICTVSDDKFSTEQLTATQREKGLKEMIEYALDIAVSEI